jgi:hypothetical protein
MFIFSPFSPFPKLLVCGQALSHCVNYTTRDIIDHWDKDFSNIVVLTDGTQVFVAISLSGLFILFFNVVFKCM